jgi:hypothetical protein
VARDRSGNQDRTARRRIDVAKAFREAEGDGRAIAPDLDDIDLDIVFVDEPKTGRAPATAPVHALAPLDAIPLLAVARELIPWHELDELSTHLLLHVDGEACTMKIVTGTAVTPSEGARILASLAGRGLVRLVRTLEPRSGERADDT